MRQNILRKELLLLLAVFLLPIVLGLAFFYYSPGSFTSRTTNYGHLIVPVIGTKDGDIVLPHNQTLKGIWTLAYHTDECGTTCQKVIEQMKTIHLLMNDNIRRVQKMVLSPVRTDFKQSTNSEKAVLFASIKNKNLSQRLLMFPSQALFLIDPNANIMLYYDTHNLHIGRVVKDLERLLKYSRTG